GALDHAVVRGVYRRQSPRGRDGRGQFVVVCGARRANRKMRRGVSSSQSGFTFLELLATIAIVIVIAAIAMPSYRTIIRDARLTTQIYEFNAALNLARSEAIKIGYPVTVCPSNDLATCTGTQWTNGMASPYTNGIECARLEIGS